MMTARLPGDVIGRWTVVDKSPNRGKKDRSVRWNCICSCGTMREVSSQSLQNGGSKSCGCLARETTARVRRKRPLTESSKNTWFLKCKNGAKVRNLCFDISKDDFLRVVSGDCEYCGEQPEEKLISTGGWRSGNQAYVPSGFFANGIDRVDNSLGYTVENCVPCCERCNRAKLKMTVGQFKDMVEKQYNKMFGHCNFFSIVQDLGNDVFMERFYGQGSGGNRPSALTN